MGYGQFLNPNCTTLSGSVLMLAEGVTGPNGTFTIFVNNMISFFRFQTGRILPCSVVASLPHNSTVCPFHDAATDTLTGAISFVGTVLDKVLGHIYLCLRYALL